jgi:hypothetical protein
LDKTAQANLIVLDRAAILAAFAHHLIPLYHPDAPKIWPEKGALGLRQTLGQNNNHHRFL